MLIKIIAVSVVVKATITAFEFYSKQTAPGDLQKAMQEASDRNELALFEKYRARECRDASEHNFVGGLADAGPNSPNRKLSGEKANRAHLRE